ncbi:MAG: hypothetical protein IJR60_07685 [Eubacterium sp.]|nr:hypothetical protein [Eubacterium sp.]
MKKHRIISFILTLVLLLSVTTTAFAASYTYSPFVKANYNQPARLTSYTVAHGLDLSVHNGEIDFAKVKSAGVNFVILRAGYRGYGKSGSLAKDTRFDTYYTAAKKQGIRIGVYFYSQAISEAEAVAEANYTAQLIGSRVPDLPVFFDYEFAGVSDGRLDSAYNAGKLPKAKMTAIVQAYCNQIEKLGYVPGVYSNTDFLNNKYNYKDLDSKYCIWNAHYTSYNSSTGRYGCTSYAGNMQMWQYSASGKVNGISTYVDSNFLYEEPMKDIMSGGKLEVEDIASRAYTGSNIKPSPKVTAGGTTLVKGEDYYVKYENNREIGTAYITVVGVNDYENCREIRKAFNIVPTKVSNLVQTNRSTNSVTFQWNAHADATKYRIQRYNGSKYVTVTHTANTQYTLDGIAPSESVKIRVAAVKAVNGKNYVGKYDTPVEMTATPGKVTSVKKTTNNNTSVRLQWAAQDYASYFEVYELNYNLQKYEFVKRASRNHITLTGLKMNTRHTYRIRAVKVMENGNKLAGEMSEGYTAYTSPSTPVIRSAASNSVKHITVKWKKASGASGYQVMWSTSKTFKSNYLTVNVNKADTVQKHLKTAKSGKKYYVRVRSFKKYGDKKIYSNWSDKLVVNVK